jgi:hypothetical protein
MYLAYTPNSQGQRFRGERAVEGESGDAARRGERVYLPYRPARPAH